MKIVKIGRKYLSYIKRIILKIIRKIRHLLIKFHLIKDNTKEPKTEEIYEALSFDKLYNELNKYDIISFDIFDTLITRAIYDPNDIFKLMEEKLKINSFLEKRKNAEIEAIKKLHKDVNLDEIYKSYIEIYKVSSDEVEKIKQLEEELEIKFCTPRNDMLKLVKKLCTNNKTLILASDMYLKKETILKMLKKCGYTESMFKKIYISNDINKRKDTKKMWRYLRFVYWRSKLVHLGDNNNSDVIFPKKYKKDTIKIMSSRELLHQSNLYNLLAPSINQRTVSDSIFLGIMINKKIFNSPFSDLMVNSISDFGYIFHAPLLNEFLKFITDKTSRMDELLFLAREGYYLQKLYQEYTELYNIKPKSNIYFLASRKATHTATLYDENNIYRLKEFTGTFKTFMKQIFDIDVEDKKKIVLPRDLELVKEKVKPYIKKILKNAEKERKAYLNYIEENIKEYNNKKIALIDLGYSGTIQYNLTKLTQKELTGIYLTNSSNTKKYSSKSKLLYCFDIKDNDYYRNILYYSLLLEFFLSAPYDNFKSLN